MVTKLFIIDFKKKKHMQTWEINNQTNIITKVYQIPLLKLLF